MLGWWRWEWMVISCWESNGGVRMLMDRRWQREDKPEEESAFRQDTVARNWPTSLQGCGSYQRREMEVEGGRECARDWEGDATLDCRCQKMVLVTAVTVM